MLFKSVASATLLTSLGALAAHAASVTTHTFDLSKPDGYIAPGTNSFSLISTVGDINLEGTFTGGYVTGYSTSAEGVVSGTFMPDVELERHNYGAGVCRGDAAPTPAPGASFYSCGNDEPHTVDGATIGTQDFIQMAFSTRVGDEDQAADVQLTELTFGWIGRFEDERSGADYVYGPLFYGDATDGAFELILDATNDGSIAAMDFQVYAGIVPTSRISDDANEISRTFSFSGLSLSEDDLTAALFGVKAGEGGSWKLLSATVEYTTATPPGDPRSDDTPPPIIPLPATGWMLLGGLGGLAWVARRRRNP